MHLTNQIRTILVLNIFESKKKSNFYPFQNDFLNCIDCYTVIQRERERDLYKEATLYHT